MNLEKCISYIEEHKKEMIPFCDSFESLYNCSINPNTMKFEPSLVKEKEECILVKYFKVDSKEGVFNTVIDSGKIVISTKIIKGKDTFLEFPTLGYSTIGSSQHDIKVFIIHGGLQEFYVEKERCNFSTIQKDEYFNLSLNYNMPSYRTFELMRDLLPYVPKYTVLYFKELFNE